MKQLAIFNRAYTQLYIELSFETSTMRWHLSRVTHGAVTSQIRFPKIQDIIREIDREI